MEKNKHLCTHKTLRVYESKRREYTGSIRANTLPLRDLHMVVPREFSCGLISIPKHQTSLNQRKLGDRVFKKGHNSNDFQTADRSKRPLVYRNASRANELTFRTLTETCSNSKYNKGHELQVLV